jgi:hypothetical protein
MLRYALALAGMAACATTPTAVDAEAPFDAHVTTDTMDASDGATSEAMLVVGELLQGRLPGDGCRSPPSGLVAAVAPLVHAPSRTQREAAFACLSKIVSAEAVPALLEIFADARFQPGLESRYSAVYMNWEVAQTALEKTVRGEHVAGLLIAYDTCTAGVGRRMLAQLLLRVVRPPDVDALRARLELETSYWPRAILLAALVKAGDVRAREEFAKVLLDTSAVGVCDLFDVAHHVAGVWIVPALARMLRAREACELNRQIWDGDVGVFVAETVQDFAVFEIGRVTGHRFSFEIDHLRFTKKERREVDSFVSVLLAAEPR